MSANTLQIQLEPPKAGAVEVLFVAGEHSGDQHASRLARQLKEQSPNIRLAALGGPALREEGVQLLFDLTESSVVGLVEVLKNYGFFKRLFDQVISWIDTHRPKVVCFVDYPGFNLRLAQQLLERKISRKGGGDVTLFYYISPQIWAWKAGRRFKMAQTLDAMGVIFPFEVDCYHDTSLETRFVGHPFVAPGYASQLQYDRQGPVLLLPGSRVQPVSRIFPVMLDALEVFLQKHPAEKALALYPEAPIRAVLERCLEGRSSTLRQAVEVRRVGASVGARAALLSSGTMSLACALAGIPGAIVYRAHPLTYLIGKQLVKVPFLGIANLLLPESPPYPEYIQGAARPEALASELEACITSSTRSEQSSAAAQSLREKLSPSHSDNAASWILKLIAQGCADWAN